MPVPENPHPDTSMWMFWSLIGLFAAFLAFVAFFVYPNQEGLISSTQLQIGALKNVSAAYAETLPIQDVGINNQGRSMFIAFVMLAHVLFANLHLGGSWIAAVSESFHIKTGSHRFDRIAKSLTLFNVILFSFGATFAIAGVLFFIALFPVFASDWFRVMWWPLLIEAILFAIEIVFLYSYWFTWDKIGRRNHQILGYGYAISVFFQTFMINMVAGGMLTPGVTEISFAGSGLLSIPYADAISMWFNPTLWRLQFHRVFAAISYMGFILAMLAVFHFLDRKGIRDKKYWDWVTSYGITWGLLGLVIQPVLGMIYMLKIQDANELAFTYIMHGPRAWEMLLMAGTLSFLFLTVMLFFLERRERLFSKLESRNLHTIFKWFFIIGLGCLFVIIQPAWLYAPFVDDPAAWANPLGVMDYKYVAIAGLILIGVVMLTIDALVLSDLKESDWGNLSKVSRAAAVFAGLLGIFIIEIMGFVRESARSPWTVYNIIPVPPGSVQYPTPLAILNIFGVWVIISVVVVIVFWLVSKVTAHHPEDAEEIKS
ncbi:MAG: cytochrome ubiquinol oxidase subunit I [Methanoregulaceae archaeon]